MGKKTEIMITVAEMIGFVKDNIKTDLFEAKTRGMVTLEAQEVQRLSSLIEMSIQNSFSKSSSDLERKIDKLVK